MKPRRNGPDRFGGVAVAALALLAGFISLPLLSLIVWTFYENAWGAMFSPVARDALLLSLKTTAISMTIIILIGPRRATLWHASTSPASDSWMPW